MPGRANRAERLAHLVMGEAWTDASLFLIELELPLWRVRRLIYDGGEWMCSLSRYPSAPVEIDAAADGRHATMPIAILLSFVEAQGISNGGRVRPDLVHAARRTDDCPPIVLRQFRMRPGNAQ